MNDHKDAIATAPLVPSAPVPALRGTVNRGWAMTLTALVVAFAIPLYQWVEFALHSELFSYVLIIPLVSGYFAWQNRARLATRPSSPPRRLALVPLITGLLILAGYAALVFRGAELPPVDALSLLMLAFVFLFIASCMFFFGLPQLRVLAFPLGFLLLVVPFPAWLTDGIESLLQHGSASVAFYMFNAIGTPVFRQELIFQLPGITLEVAPECSGIRSTLALFITSIVAGHVFLQSPWKRTLLAACVLPLALLRNGFRVFTIGELCVRISPDMIHSYIHRQGGPIFFALSLVPFSLLLLLFARSERAASRARHSA